MARWQDWVEQHLPPGTRETSGYRTPQQEAALGGPTSSYHSRGTPTEPGAIDVGGPCKTGSRERYSPVRVARRSSGRTGDEVAGWAGGDR